MSKFLIGKDMLFLYNDSNNVIAKFNHNLVNPPAISQIISSFQNIKCKNNLVMNIPDKVEIYPENLNFEHKRSFSDLIFDLLTHNSNGLYQAINIKAFLLDLKRKSDIPLYYTCDSHYTLLTAYHIFQFLCDQINKLYSLDIKINKEKLFNDNPIVHTDLLNPVNYQNYLKDLNNLYQQTGKEYIQSGKTYVINENQKFNQWKLKFLKSKEGSKFMRKYHNDRKLRKVVRKIVPENDINRIKINHDTINCIDLDFSFVFGSYFGNTENLPERLNFLKGHEKYLGQLLFIHTVNNKDLIFDKKLLLIGDSYSSIGLKDLFSQYFREFYYIYSGDINPEVVNLINPEVFIFEKASRFL